MKGRPIDQLVYECLFPKPRTNDPINFQVHLNRNLIPEVRQEVVSFYGHLDTQEAKYPGLDYCHPIHRIRLSRWQWHRRLFRAFDALRLTESEIAGLTKWEGTKWAKERFERDSGIIIRDTLSDDIADWVEPEDRPQPMRARTSTEPDDLDEEATATPDEDMEREEDSDGELESIGVELNERLRERAARREAGNMSEPLDEEWEQWLKNAIESGQLPFLTEQILRQSTHLPIPPALLPRMLSAARAGQWQDIPDLLHGVLRQALENEASTSNPESSTPSASSNRPSRSSISGIFRRTYSDLRLPEATANSTPEVRLHRTAQPGA
ncbi:hypothetical protein F4779DRAFT_496566 [Xylariaceae sp. FL0662B]|nr:hypothetical protein F4779DRAFT_496566 [Xylariaceae sp. FL0662B]